MSHAFWDWSLECYDRPAVASACLRLQDQHGLNINICLWCCWLAEEGRTAGPAIEQAINALKSWNGEITAAIRDIRRKLKDQPRAGALYRSVLACELDAEQVEQDILFELAADLPASPWNKEETAARALDDYARTRGVQPDFTPLLKAVFSTVKKV